MLRGVKKYSVKFCTKLYQRPLLAIALFFGILAPMLIFAAIAEDVHEGDGLHWDTPLLQYIHGFSTPARDNLVIAITNLGGISVMVPFCAVVVLWLYFSGHAQSAYFYAIATGGAGILNLITKLLFGRDRPDLWISPAPEFDFGFPSGHSMISMAVAAALTFVAWPTRWRWPVAILGAFFAFTIGLSRLYLGVHYPSDVVGGWCASLIWVTGFYFIDRRISRRRNNTG